MPQAAKLPLRPLAVMVLGLLVGAGLAGCLTFEEEPRTVATSCDAAPGPSDGRRAERPSLPPASDGGTVTRRTLKAEPVRLLTFLGSEGGLRDAADLAATQFRNLGVQVEVQHVSSSTDAATLRQTVRPLLEDNGVTAIVGGVDNESTWALLDEAIRARVPVITPVATAPSLTEARSNDGFFFRVPPSDTFAGRALGELVWSAGCRTAVVLVPEGTATGPVADGFRQAFEQKGGIVREVIEVQEPVDAEDVVNRINRYDPEAMVLALEAGPAAEVFRKAYEERRTAETATFLGPGLETKAFADEAGDARDGRTIAAGLRGASLKRPADELPEAFRNAYRQAAGKAPVPWAAETYDAVYAAVLAAECAGSAESAAVQARLRDVWNDREGDSHVSGANPATAVTTARNCQVDYVGASSQANADWDARGEPNRAVYREWLLLEDGTPSTTNRNDLVVEA